MSLAAPLSAVLAAIVPLGTGLALGERPGAPAAIGIPLALVAVVLFSRGETADPDHSPTTGAVTRAGSSVLVLSSVAGLGFGLFFVALGQVGEDSGIWPVVIARAASAAAIVGVLVVARTRPAVPRDARGVALGAGLFDAGANVFVLLANREGLLSVVAVIVSMYPAATVVLAQVVLRERFTRTHAVASACALGAIGAFAVAH
jgi:drug/metabolite transporter (DMT)-like permease